MNDLAVALLEQIAGVDCVLRYGTVVTASPLTITVGASTVAVPAVALMSPPGGAYVAVLEQGADRLVLGQIPAQYMPAVLAVHTLTTAFTTTGTHTIGQAEGLTRTVNDIAGRRYRFTVVVQPYAPGGVNSARFALLRDGVSIRVWDVQNLIAAGSAASTLTHTELIAVTHANSVYSITLQAVTNNTSVSSNATSVLPRQLIIEDIGSV